jgi:hypothetical protein
VSNPTRPFRQERVSIFTNKLKIKCARRPLFTFSSKANMPLYFTFFYSPKSNMYCSCRTICKYYDYYFLCSFSSISKTKISFACLVPNSLSCRFYSKIGLFCDYIIIWKEVNLEIWLLQKIFQSGKMI